MINKVLMSLVAGSLFFMTSAIACPKANGMGKCGTGKYSTAKCSTKRGYNAVPKVIRAVSKTGITAAQTRKIAEGLAEYEATMHDISKMAIFPVDSFINDEFDEKKFIGEMSEKFIATVAAKAALYKYVFSVLDTEQRKIFKREYAAPLIREMISSY